MTSKSMYDALTDNKKRCLNCGHELTYEKYCPQCGQATTVGRLSAKIFLTDALAGITRLNKGFLYTCWLLLISPWRVLSDYIHGRRKNYSGPVQTLIVLCFIAIFLDSLFGDGIVTQSRQELATIFSGTELGGIWRQVADWYASSPTFQYLIVFIPAIPAFMLVTRKAGHYQYNWAESFVAAIYTSCGVLMVSLLTHPLNLLSPHIDFTFHITNIYILLMGSIGIYKALRPICATKAKRILRLLGFYGLSALNYMLLLILFGIIVALYCFPWDPAS